jgi:hypothetical protein
MRAITTLAVFAVFSVFGITACTQEPEKKPMGPTSETSRIPWNSPVAGQGQGQFGLLPQNQYRR